MSSSLTPSSAIANTHIRSDSQFLRTLAHAIGLLNTQLEPHPPLNHDPTLGTLIQPINQPTNSQAHLYCKIPSSGLHQDIHITFVYASNRAVGMHESSLGYAPLKYVWRLAERESDKSYRISPGSPLDENDVPKRRNAKRCNRDPTRLSAKRILGRVPKGYTSA
ncbi:hypothetical protein K458DRAFT_386128 [Lentithecium fluviatile CBS 122367]|uniref:Uncharacterized protein n=1 Tax=Lentithecium fluviatile CBS 122367 TaxID=1168545 RepID=A0A6G1JA64_9PLEO|nr:hypothetical protein K458DRAFT_386128 [Lentithecium fluviatile CBS 122367]